MLVLLTLIVAIAGYFAGHFLSVLYGVDVMPYKRGIAGFTVRRDLQGT